MNVYEIYSNVWELLNILFTTGHDFFSVQKMNGGGGLTRKSRKAGLASAKSTKFKSWNRLSSASCDQLAFMKDGPLTTKNSELQLSSKVLQNSTNNIRFTEQKEKKDNCKFVS